LEVGGKQSRQQQNRTSWSGIRFCLLGAILMLSLATFAFQPRDLTVLKNPTRPVRLQPARQPVKQAISHSEPTLSLATIVLQPKDRTVLKNPTRPVRLQPARQPVKQAISHPEPNTRAPLSATLDTTLEFAPAKPVAREEPLFPDELPTTARDDLPPLEGGSLVHYLECPTDARGGFAFLDALPVGKGGVLAFGKLRAGYGRIFPDNSILSRGQNGTAWEEQSFFYLKASFRF